MVTAKIAILLSLCNIAAESYKFLAKLLKRDNPRGDVAARAVGK
jgi:hypothetical protein